MSKGIPPDEHGLNFDGVVDWVDDGLGGCRRSAVSTLASFAETVGRASTMAEVHARVGELLRVIDDWAEKRGGR